MTNIYKIPKASNTLMDDRGFYDISVVHPIPENLQETIDRILEKYDYQGFKKYFPVCDEMQNWYIFLKDPSGSFMACIYQIKEEWICDKFTKDGIGGFLNKFETRKFQNFSYCVLFLIENNDTVVMENN